MSAFPLGDSRAGGTNTRSGTQPLGLSLPLPFTLGGTLNELHHPFEPQLPCVGMEVLVFALRIEADVCESTFRAECISQCCFEIQIPRENGGCPKTCVWSRGVCSVHSSPSLMKTVCSLLFAPSLREVRMGSSRASGTVLSRLKQLVLASLHLEEQSV